MWELVVITVGKFSDQGFRQSADRYALMSGGEWKVRLAPVGASKKKDPNACRQEEGDALLKRVPKGCITVALDAAGEELDSPAFGRLLGRWKDSGQRVAFLVGGAHGLHESVLRPAKLRLSLSRMTLPHELAAVVLLEQIYRASALYAGKAYAK